ncbi:MAG: AAA family ATPase [Proteobacteria bacterium]|nr:AAA family ATPase [Pseudomonadota bacterium]
MSGPVILSVCGKGGVGKTSISALLSRVLAEDPKKRVLAIDADPAVGLATALDLPVARTVDDIRNSLIDRLTDKGGGGGRDKAAVLAELDYQLAEALAERDNLAFLAVGRPETDGCYCRLNAFLKEVIAQTAGRFDYVVIDGEAGIEQVNRRVMERITHLLLVTDASVKGRRVAETIEDVARKMTGFSHAGLFVNQVRDQGDVPAVMADTRLTVVGSMADDPVLHRFDREGQSLLGLPEGPSLDALRLLADTFVRNAT